MSPIHLRSLVHLTVDLITFLYLLLNWASWEIASVVAPVDGVFVIGRGFSLQHLLTVLLPLTSSTACLLQFLIY